jgi:hypothetical protein
MKLAAFDIEIAKILPAETRNLLDHQPLGITCAAVAFNDGKPPIVWHGVPRISRDECVAMVRALQALEQEGYALVSWNGCGFDFPVLATESGMTDDCGRMALAHVDLMLHVVFNNGYFLALSKALQGAGLEGKTHSARLRDGTVVTELGPNAPRLWAEGEHQVVMDYLRQDVAQTVQLADHVARSHAIKWTSNRGSPMRVAVPRLLSVRDCFAIPQPDTSWMSDAPSRAQFVSWIPGFRAPAR